MILLKIGGYYRIKSNLKYNIHFVKDRLYPTIMEIDTLKPEYMFLILEYCESQTLNYSYKVLVNEQIGYVFGLVLREVVEIE